jgi:hypothetical protein
LDLLELLRDAIASSIGAMVVEKSRVKVVSFVAVEVCPTAGCAPRWESFYYCSELAGPPRLSEIYAEFADRVEHRGGNASLTSPSIFLL